jgi:hypothetical protein
VAEVKWRRLSSAERNNVLDASLIGALTSPWFHSGMFTSGQRRKRQ